jgi:hypothetical protein
VIVMPAVTHGRTTSSGPSTERVMTWTGLIVDEDTHRSSATIACHVDTNSRSASVDARAISSTLNAMVALIGWTVASPGPHSRDLQPTLEEDPRP